MTITWCTWVGAVRSSRQCGYGLWAALLLASPLLAATSDLLVEVRDAQGVAVSNAVVTLTASGAAPALTVQRVEVGQVGQEFSPLVTLVPVGSTVLFPNRDAVAHHVYSFSPACKFDLPLYTGAPPQEVVCPVPGVITLGCNIHDWMLAYVFVTDTPWHGLTGADGRVTLRDVPPGPAAVNVWHPRQRGTPPALTVSAGSTPPLVVTVPLRPESKRRRAPVVGGAGGYR
jgi:plastocyanin